MANWRTFLTNNKRQRLKMKKERISPNQDQTHHFKQNLQDSNEPCNLGSKRDKAPNTLIKLKKLRTEQTLVPHRIGATVRLKLAPETNWRR